MDKHKYRYNIVIDHDSLYKLDFSKVVPFTKRDMLYIVDPLIAFSITNISSRSTGIFDLSALVEGHKVFACKDYMERCNEFVPRMDARIERYFILKRDTYLFFDMEEQRVLSSTMKKHNLSATVEVYLRDSIYDNFKRIEFVNLTTKQVMAVSAHIDSMGAYVTAKAFEFHRMYGQAYNGKDNHYSRFGNDLKVSLMDVYRARYPEIANIKSKEELKVYYKALSKKHHPDLGGDPGVFAIINSDMEEMRNTTWYSNLPDKPIGTRSKEDKDDGEIRLLEFARDYVKEDVVEAEKQEAMKDFVQSVEYEEDKNIKDEVGDTKTEDQKAEPEVEQQEEPKTEKQEEPKEEKITKEEPVEDTFGINIDSFLGGGGES